MTLNQAKKMIDSAIKQAEQLQIAITVCIVDEHGTLVASERMDGAIPISPEFAYTKAYTSAVIGLPSGEIAQYSGEHKPLYGISSAFGGKIMTIAGGFPLKEGNKTIGAIGVGGSYDVNQDVECAQAGMKTL